MKSIYRKGLLAVLIVSVVCISCNSDQSTPDPHNDLQLAVAPSYGGTLVIGIPRDVDTFNPLFNASVFAKEITHLVLLGLADLDEKSEFKPELAGSWERSDDHLTLTYHLRKGMKWADGHPITAADVKFTYDLIMDSTVASPLHAYTEYIQSVNVVDSHTVSFKFSQPYPFQIFDTAGEILPKHVLEKVDRRAVRTHEFGKNPLASGPFVVKEWKHQQHIILAPNENYFGGRPYLDRIIFKIVPDNHNLLTQLQTGEVDMAIGIPPTDAHRLQAENAHLILHALSGRLYYYMEYNKTNPLFASAEVRRALTLAIDRQKMVDALLYGYGRPCVGHVSPAVGWAFNDQLQPLPYDPQQAQTLLAQAGWRDSDSDGWLDRDGKPFAFTLKTDAANQTKSDAAVVIQDYLKKIGVKVNIKPVEWTTLLKELREKNFEAYIGGWSTPPYVDPYPVFHSAATQLFNYGSYANPRVDELITKGSEELNPQKAAQIWKEFQELVYADQPYTFLFWIDRVVAVNRRFANVTPNALSALYNVEKWYQQGNFAANEQ